MSLSDLDLQKVINASGKMSILGVSTLSDEVTDAMKEGAQSFYVMDDLRRAAGKQIAEFMETDAAMITNSASSAIVLAVSGLLTKDNTNLVHNISARDELDRNEVIIMTGHNIDYGAPIETMIRLTGAEVKFAGYANGCTSGQIEEAISDRTLAMIYVQSHHCVQKNMPDLASVSQLMKKHDVPFLIDAAAEADFTAYTGLADLCIISGSKAISGPTSGILAGKQPYIDYATSHEKGIGRAMKVGKESIIGLLRALQLYSPQPVSESEQRSLLQRLQSLDTFKGVTSTIIKDSSRNIYRLRLSIDPTLAGIAALDIIKELKRGDIAIYTRDYHANQGSFEIDPRALTKEDVQIIYAKLKRLLGG